MPPLITILLILIFIFALCLMYDSHKVDVELKKQQQESQNRIAEAHAEFIKIQTEKIKEIEVYRNNLINEYANRNSTPTSIEDDIPKPREDGQA